MAAYYPVSLDLAGRRCVVVGGGAIAEGKVDGLLAACARVAVVAPALSPSLAAHHEAGRLAWVAREYRAGDLAGAWLTIAATDDGAVNDAVWRDAEAAGVLAQVVDDPPRCHFILPSIVARGDLTVAVSTSGSAPALAVRLRERIGAMLGDEHARFLAMARRVRAPLARRTPDFATRKRAWYGLVDSDVLERLRAGDEAGARARFVEWLGVAPPAEEEPPAAGAGGYVCPAGRPCVPGCTGAGARRAAAVRSLGMEDGPSENGPAGAAAAERSPGTVWLVGAGPGDPELITLAGVRALRGADVVLFDRLAHPDLLEEAPPHALRIDVGKSAGDAAAGRGMTQREIDALIVAHACAGRAVVRLKGGDPFVFGRGSEEAAACARHGIPCRVVPGVSSAIAAPASAGIPVTARGTAASFAVVTAHRADGADDDPLAGVAHADTVVVLMGAARLAAVADALVAHGRDASTPAAVVERGTLPGQRTVRGTLGTIAVRAAAEDVRAPATLVVGDVVALPVVPVAAAPGNAVARYETGGLPRSREATR